MNFKSVLGDDCRKRCKCIRDSYQRIKRKNKLPTGSAAGSKSKKWPLMERLTFLENVPTERKTICNIEGTNDSENEVSNYDESFLNKEKDINVEPNEIEMNSERTSGIIMVNAPSSATEVDVEETADDEKLNKKKTGKSTGSVLKKKKQNQNSTMQAALLNYWKEWDAERRAQIQALTPQSTQDKESVGGITSFCSHVGTMLRKLTPALRIEAKTKVFNILADYELRSLNEHTSVSGLSTSSSSPPFDENSSSNPYSPITFVASPISPLCEPTDLSILNTINFPTNTSENMSNTYFPLDNFSYLP